MRSAKTNHVLNLVSDVSLVPRAAAGGAGAGLPDCAAVAQEREEEEAEPRLVNRLRPAQDLPAGEIQVRFEFSSNCPILKDFHYSRSFHINLSLFIPPN